MTPDAQAKDGEDLSEDPGPHAVFFSCVRRAGRGCGIQGDLWLSSSSPPAFDTVDTVDNVKSVDSVDNVNSVDSVDNAVSYTHLTLPTILPV